MKKKIIALLAVIQLVTSFAGCGPSAGEIIGKWSGDYAEDANEVRYNYAADIGDPDKISVLEFSEDFTGSWTVGELSDQFTWERNGSEVTLLFDYGRIEVLAFKNEELHHTLPGGAFKLIFIKQ